MGNRIRSNLFKGIGLEDIQRHLNFGNALVNLHITYTLSRIPCFWLGLVCLDMRSDAGMALQGQITQVMQTTYQFSPLNVIGFEMLYGAFPFVAHFLTRSLSGGLAVLYSRIMDPGTRTLAQRTCILDSWTWNLDLGSTVVS